jgi:restriction system protein
MAVPTLEALFVPVLRVLAAAPDGLPRKELRERVARDVGLTETEREEMTAGGRRPRYSSRIGWASTTLRLAGLVEPEELIHAALAELKTALKVDLLDRLHGATPLFFERVVLDVLDAMGYTGDLGSVEHRGKSGDGGIDGVLNQDPLGLERVYVQAKRWQCTVGREVVQAFVGAMDAERANKGVILTTSTFTAKAREYASQSSRVIRLVDGLQLAGLMVQFGVGVSIETKIALPRVDQDYFDDG